MDGYIEKQEYFGLLLEQDSRKEMKIIRVIKKLKISKKINEHYYVVYI